ncbi:SPFH domain-containing protein [Campylobacter corcagiensis]|uniref:Prohibitin family protein n=1 Tax=Campylobacter corcagiensis TaxID=1448857 RepID=A0A7M1LGP2_9BACT|nr:prohibitin family protein [Campylobacter corcagiensis]QKF64029.1 prohibitin family protein, SPFH superfamily [Campylobacter corcagiensis]QOQ87769.1 prohibitin family protein [Campylobacter corcagiensis]
MPADLNDYFNKKRNNNNNSGGGGNFKGPDFSNMKMPDFKGFGKFSWAIYTIAGLIFLLVLFRPFVTIESGYVGIKSTWQKYENTPLQPGLHFFIPFMQEVFIVDTRVRTIDYTNVDVSGSTDKNSGIIRMSAISVPDSRNLPVSIDLTVQYSLNENTAPNTIASWGPSWESKIVDRTVRDVILRVVGKFTAEEIPTKRGEISAAITKEITDNIHGIASKPVDVHAIQLREIILPQKIREQIERVQIAKQEAERAKYEVERANQEALKKAALAEGTAQATIIEAQGRADAKKVEADAEAYANIEIAKSLDNNILSMKQIETQAKFNEALRENKDAKIFLTPGGAVPNIWVDTKDKIRPSISGQNSKQGYTPTSSSDYFEGKIQ